MSPVRRLLGYVRPYRRAFLIGLACVLLTQGVALTAPLVLKYAIDDLDKGITGVKLTVTGVVPGITAEEFEAAAEDAKQNCPVSKALTGTTITVEASLAS